MVEGELLSDRRQAPRRKRDEGMNIKLQLPSLMHLRPRITVIGVGGAGSNAVNNMITSGLTGVDFIVANTDAQSLANSHAEKRVQLGAALTEGLGAGARPEIGKAAAEEAADEIRQHVARSHMVFVAAGMGGGTGTGAAAVIARIAREAGALTVGVVTKPFQFEGTRRMRAAEAGIAALRPEVDTLIVIPNQNLFRVANERTTFSDAFVMADQVLYSGIACVVDLIVKEGLINLDFADVRAIMSGMGTAMMGTGEAAGDRRATLAAEEAISNPLLDDISLRGAKGLLVSITGSRNLTLYEVDEAATRVRQEVDPEANIIVGATFDDSLGDKVRVSIVASGMERQAEMAAAVAAQPVAMAAQPPPIDTQPPFIEPYPSPYAQAEAMPTAAAPAGASAPFAQNAAFEAPRSEIGPSAYEAHHMPHHADKHPGLPPLAQIAPERGGQSDISRALSEAMSAREAPAHRHDPGHPPPSPAPWVSPKGAVFEDAAPHGWSPAPTQPVAGGRRVPNVDEFPELAQREYHAKMAQYSGYGADENVAPQRPRAYTHTAPAAEPKRGFFARLFGRKKRPSQDTSKQSTYAQAHPSDVPSRDVADAQRRSGAPHGSSASRRSEQEVVDLPTFFGTRQK